MKFQHRIYEIVARIPMGKVCTYGQLSDMAGVPNGARLAGIAMSYAPKDLPSHRVVNIKGDMSPDHVFGGQEHQRKLLRDEGITFLKNGRIDMKKHIWHG